MSNDKVPRRKRPMKSGETRDEVRDTSEEPEAGDFSDPRVRWPDDEWQTTEQPAGEWPPSRARGRPAAGQAGDEELPDVSGFGDGSVIVERTAGEVSARCHDEQANFLALNLMHDIVTGRRTADEARAYYAKEFLDYRRGKPTPYMERLRFPPGDESAADPDRRVLSDDDMQRAVREGKQASRPSA